MSPFEWARAPGILLNKISEHRGTLVWLPNFAFSFMAESVRDEAIAAGLDLSTVRMWINCSEPVSEISQRRFQQRFATSGVASSAIVASYAMAENVFAVTQSLIGDLRVCHADAGTFTREHRVVPVVDGQPAVEFVSNGRPLETTEVRIRDREGAILPEGSVGEIELRGTHLFSGYWNRPDLDAKAFTDGWYKTGDLGFISNDEIYVTGRLKDLIIIQGRNFYPTDIEEAVGRLDGVVGGRVVAFGVPDRRFDTESLVVLLESSLEGGGSAKLALQVRKMIAQQFDCTPEDVRVVPPRWLVKSTAGKLARNDNREKYFREYRSTA
jgi:acyl-CoA synthetase (AMP-forming)/AMP-acid ligase II